MTDKALTEIASRHQAHLERLKSGEVKKFDSFLTDMDKELKVSLLSLDSSSLTRRQIEAEIKQVGLMMQGHYSAYEEVFNESIKSVAAYEAGFEIRSLEHVVDGVSFYMPSDSQLRAAVFLAPLKDMTGVDGGALLKGLFDKMSNDSVDRIQSAVRSGFSNGETTSQIVGRIRGSVASGGVDSIKILKRDAETIARTALQHASQQARQATWERNSKVVDRYKISATLDRKTSSTCRSLDGMIFEMGKGHPTPPFHRLCRTTTVAVLNKKYDDLSAYRTRVQRDPKTGKITRTSANTTYYDWLKRQPNGVQDSIVGKSRGKLLRDGGLSSERFAELQLNKKFMPITLDKMRELDPVAFTRAGL